MIMVYSWEQNGIDCKVKFEMAKNANKSVFYAVLLLLRSKLVFRYLVQLLSPQPSSLALIALADSRSSNPGGDYC